MLSPTVTRLADKIMDEYDELKEEISDRIHTVIDDYVSCNNFLDNINIINEEVGGVYEAMKLYEDSFGEFGQAKDMTKSNFYAKLAFISVYDKVTEEVNNRIELNEEGSEDDYQETEDDKLSSTSTVEIESDL